MSNYVCPHCGKEIELTKAISHEIEINLRREIDAQVRREVEGAASVEMEDLRKALKEKELKVNELRDKELSLREEKRRLEDREKELSLEVSRTIDEEKQKLEEAILKKTYEEHRMRDLEKDKKINDLMRSLEEAQRKANLGSQQLQGEVLELDLEDNLRQSFPHDSIEPVGKGVRGADIKQIVKSPLGNICGVILWESKRTKAWSHEWLGKLKEDMRDEKANVPVIVTTTLPKEVPNGLGILEGVWVVKYELALSLATILRKGLLDVARQRAMLDQKADKASMLYDYVMGHEFRQQVEALAEVFTEMNDQLTKERTAFERIWKTREGQIRRMITSTINIYGSVQGVVGSHMPQIKGLDLMELEDGEN